MTDVVGVPLEDGWRHRLREESIGYWRAVTWTKIERHVKLKDLHPVYRQALQDVVRAATEGERNHLSEAVPDCKIRFARIMDYVARHGYLPRPPVLWITRNGLEILEGHHRISAYLLCRGELTSTARPLPPACSETQNYWIASEHPSLVPLLCSPGR